ncbi:MAG: DUF814 domain-containing protein [Fibrobacter sp.]|nr:DUF814 domain-containing protein [Fibrobacter sp.]
MTLNSLNVTEYAENLKKHLKQIIHKQEKKLIKQQEELEESKRYLWYQQIADSLLSSTQTINHGSTEVLLLNIHTQKNETVSLNPKLDKNENAQLYYKKSKRAKRGEEISAKKVQTSMEEIQNLKSVLAQIDECISNNPDILQLKELENSIETISNPTQSGQKSSTIPSHEKVPYRHFTTDGWDIFVGKNDTQNDELTTRFAKPSDIWLHVAGHAGSHVVVRRPKEKPFPPKEIIEIAAALAIWFSKAKHTSFAEVHYTEARFVHKRRHAPAGEVIAERCKSVRTSPRSPQDIFKTSFLDD